MRLQTFSATFTILALYACKTPTTNSTASNMASISVGGIDQSADQSKSKLSISDGSSTKVVALQDLSATSLTPGTYTFSLQLFNSTGGLYAKNDESVDACKPVKTALNQGSNNLKLTVCKVDSGGQIGSPLPQNSQTNGANANIDVDVYDPSSSSNGGTQNNLVFTSAANFVQTVSSASSLDQLKGKTVTIKGLSGFIDSDSNTSTSWNSLGSQALYVQCLLMSGNPTVNFPKDQTYSFTGVFSSLNISGQNYFLSVGKCSLSK